MDLRNTNKSGAMECSASRSVSCLCCHTVCTHCDDGAAASDAFSPQSPVLSTKTEQLISIPYGEFNAAWTGRLEVVTKAVELAVA